MLYLQYQINRVMRILSQTVFTSYPVTGNNSIEWSTRSEGSVLFILSGGVTF